MREARCCFAKVIKVQFILFVHFHMKYLLFIFSSCLFCKISFAQTYIIPTLGYDFMSVKSVFIDPNFHGFEVSSAPYSIKGLQYGLEIKQHIYKSLSISLSTNFAQRDAQANIFSPIPIYGFRFNHLRGNLSLNYNLNAYLTLGIGYDYNQIKVLDYILLNKMLSPVSGPLFIERGLNINASSSWKNIDIKVYFHKGINENISNSSHELSIKPVDYFGISLGYRIKALNSFKKPKKAECPSF